MVFIYEAWDLGCRQGTIQPCLRLLHFPCRDVARREHGTERHVATAQGRRKIGPKGLRERCHFGYHKIYNIYISQAFGSGWFKLMTRSTVACKKGGE